MKRLYDRLASSSVTGAVCFSVPFERDASKLAQGVASGAPSREEVVSQPASARCLSPSAV